MRKSLTTVAAVAGALLSVGALSAPPAAAAGGRTFTVTLTGEAEVPKPGDPDGTGTAVLRLNPGHEQVCSSITVKDVDELASAHIHEAPAGQAGAVVVKLPVTSGCVDVDRAQIVDILRNPENYYVNVHNAEYPGGALRGQLALQR